MADVTGKIYEGFAEYLLRALGWKPEPAEAGQRTYLVGRAVPALCHSSEGICQHAYECHRHSNANKLPFGPWYDPDFFLLDAKGSPFGCIHVTHWSNPSSSQYKFWRTIEDHFQYKTQFGREFLSLNFVFEALDPDRLPQLIQDSSDLVSLHGWKPATGSIHATSYDATLAFPVGFYPLKAFANSLPEHALRLTASRRGNFYERVWSDLARSDKDVRRLVSLCKRQLRNALASDPHPRYSNEALSRLRDNCFRGRKVAIGLRPSASRYRKGIQHAFILQEVIREYWGSRVDVDESLWRILCSPPRFPATEFSACLGRHLTSTEVDSWIELLSSISIRMDHWVPVPLLNATAGIGQQVAWDEDMSMFIQSVRGLDAKDRAAFRTQLDELFDEYRTAYGVSDVLKDLTNPSRAAAKVAYIFERYLGLSQKEFVGALVPDMLSPYSSPPHQSVVKDAYNWPVDVLLVVYDLGSMQHITTALPRAFKKKTGEDLRPYAYMGNLGQLVSHMIAGTPVGQYFSSKCRLCEADFYEVIWPLFAECLWGAIKGQSALSPADATVTYRYKKAMRIISSPDLEPISFLFRSSMPNLSDGPTLRGAFNELSTARGWSRAALTTKAAGLDETTGAIVQTQSVFGKKHIADKTKELAARMRSVQMELVDGQVFGPASEPKRHFLVVDGDWPLESKINLLESGFEAVFEIGELDALAARLEEDLS